MTSDEFLSEFPFGILAADPTNERSEWIVSLEKVDDSIVGGYVSPNKDIYLNVSNAQTKDDGLIIETKSQPVRKLFVRPLSKETGAKALDSAKDD